MIFSYFLFFDRDSWNKERAEKDELLKNGKLQLSQQQARAQEAEVSCLLGMIDFSSVPAVVILRNFDGIANLRFLLSTMEREERGTRGSYKNHRVVIK